MTSPSRTRSLTLVILTLAGLLAPAPAGACWDGFSATVGDVQEYGSDTSWGLAQVEERARWLGRIDALLPDGATVMDEWGTVSVYVGDEEHDLEWRDGHYLTLFREVARIVGASPETIRRARRLETPVYVVQAGAFADRAAAERYASELSEDEAATHGFLEAGGFPADNPEAHVVSVPGVRELHRVYVGAFVDRAEAEAVAATLGGHAFVRTLG
ncbi:MAG: SPOR domain-containing protein [Sandaracinaceae bacterium]|nr:SPOR domain-containing protein [Sandaracinaceae bacterium]